MKTLFVLVIIVLIGVGIYWYAVEQRPAEPAEQIEDDVAEGSERAKNSIRDKFERFSLRSDDIKEELTQTGNVIRRKAREFGERVSDATADARITAAIKTKLVADPDLSALSISVDTTDGVVTLSGAVSSPEAIGKAMLLALETEGVREAISTLQVRRVREAPTQAEPRPVERDTNALPAK